MNSLSCVIVEGGETEVARGRETVQAYVNMYKAKKQCMYVQDKRAMYERNEVSTVILDWGCRC